MKRSARAFRAPHRRSAERVTHDAGHQYHIGLGPGEAAPTVLLVGDPGRARRIAARFEKVRIERSHREYLTFTGTFHGRPLTVMATGMGPDNTEIAVVETSQIVDRPMFLRIGSSGGLQPGIRIGNVVISTGALRLENTSLFFVEEGYPAVADPWVVLALCDAAQQAGVRHHVGLTATAPGFYGAQARAVPGFPPRFPDMDARLARQGIANFEMETSCLFTLATLRGLRAGAVCGVYAERGRNRFASDTQRVAAEARAITVGLGALDVLAKMDAAARKRSAVRWTPSMGY